MKILIVNPILYTPPEAGGRVPRQASVRHTLIYNLALGFKEAGHEPTLLCSEEYKPQADSEFDFEVVFLKNRIKRLIPSFPNGFPILSGMFRYLVRNSHKYDRIIVSEAFSQAALVSSLVCPRKTLIWQEVAEFFPGKRLACALWYGMVVRFLMRKSLFVGRSPRALAFLKRYANNVSEDFIVHGINVDIFRPLGTKQKYFITVAQLIPRKRIDVTIAKFAQFYKLDTQDYKLYIVGGGPLENELRAKAEDCGISDAVVFLGKLGQSEVVTALSAATLFLTDTEHEFNMVSMDEAIACGTPVISNSVPYLSDLFDIYGFGVKDDAWDHTTIRNVLDNYDFYFKNCIDYRRQLSYKAIAEKLAGSCLLVGD